MYRDSERLMFFAIIFLAFSSFSIGASYMVGGVYGYIVGGAFLVISIYLGFKSVREDNKERTGLKKSKNIVEN
jgi:hypothetical protein